MTLPDQMTAEALRDLLESYERRMATLPVPTPPADAPSLVSVEGGRLAQSGHDETGHYYRVVGETLPGRAQVEGFQAKYPVVDLVFRWDVAVAPGPFVVETSPALLLATDGTLRPDAFLTDPVREHRFVPDSASGPVREVRLRFAVPGRTLAVGPVIREAASAGPGPLRYRVPAQATSIWGDGEVVYATGHRVRVHESGADALRRPTADGGLEVRPGEIQAEFHGHRPALVRIGNTWIPTPAL